VNDMVRCSHGEYSKNEIILMEQKMISVLSWRLNPPTSCEFVKLLLTTLYVNIRIKESCRFLEEVTDNAIFFTELSIWDCFFIGQSPSTIAIASILNAIDSLASHPLSDTVRASFLHCFDDLLPNENDLNIARNRLKDDYNRSSESQNCDYHRSQLSPTGVEQCY